MPPPPPSKSYLLKFDTSSDEGSEEERLMETKFQKEDHSLSNLFSMMRSATSNDPDNQCPKSKNDEDVNEKHQDQVKKQKKNKRKKKKNIRTSKNTIKKRVEFSTVHVRELYRDIHNDGVPNEGGWPLGLLNDIHKEYYTDVDAFEKNKQLELQNRYNHFIHSRRRQQISISTKSRRKRSNSKNGEELRKIEEQKEKEEDLESLPIYVPESFVFETRPFDYKRSNYTMNSSLKSKDSGTDPTLEWEEVKSMGRNVLFGPLLESERRDLLIRDARLHFVNTHSKESTDSHSPLKQKARNRADSIILEEVYCSSAVNQIRNELEQIRINRTSDTSTGCSCRKLVVILQSDLSAGGGKRSHHHRRIQEKKVKEELRKRHIQYSTSATREELEKLLHDIVEEQGCCSDRDCECFRNGISCQADTCSCWNPSHNRISGSHRKGEDNVSVPAEIIRKNCGNENGIYIVDFDAIQEYRDQFTKSVQTSLCGFIQN